MKLTFAIALGAALCAFSGSQAAAQRDSGRVQFCPAKPVCGGGQISVCRSPGGAGSGCFCRSWSGCIGQPRGGTVNRPSNVPSAVQPRRTPAQPQIKIAPTR